MYFVRNVIFIIPEKEWIPQSVSSTTRFYLLLYATTIRMHFLMNDHLIRQNGLLRKNCMLMILTWSSLKETQVMISMHICFFRYKKNISSLLSDMRFFIRKWVLSQLPPLETRYCTFLFFIHKYPNHIIIKIILSYLIVSLDQYQLSRYWSYVNSTIREWMKKIGTRNWTEICNLKRP